jgi:hypothetical protein
LIYDRLNEGGVATYWLPAHNTLESDTNAILRGFCDVFPDCSLWAGWDTDWMMAGSRNGEWARSEAAFVRSWEDPALRDELRAIGIEKPEQLGAMFMADADQIREWIGDSPPLVDDRPKRLSNVRHSPQRARVVYRDWMDADLARRRFETSEFIRDAWPPEMRDRSLAYFEYQGAINDISTKQPFGVRAWIERLHEILTETDLATLVVWQLGDTDDKQSAVERLLERGEPQFKYRRSLAIKAFSARDYDAAAAFLFTSPKKPLRNATSFYLRLYALCMAGKVDRAQAVAAAMARWLPDDAVQREYYAWLTETFGFAPSLDAAGVDPEAAEAS